METNFHPIRSLGQELFHISDVRVASNRHPLFVNLYDRVLSLSLSLSLDPLKPRDQIN